MSNNKNSQYDPGLIIKEVHDLAGQFLRVSDTRSAVPEYYSHFNVTYNLNNKPTVIEYFRGLTSHKTVVGIIPDVSGSLNNKYLVLRKVPDNTLFHLWFNVDGTGVDPAPANSTPIMVDISSNDSASIIATAISITVNSLFKDYFKVSRNGGTVEIASVKLGVVDDSVDFNTGFVLSNTQGTQETVNRIEISYDINNNPIYQGQALIGMVYNVFTGKFEQNPIVDIGNIVVNVDTDGFDLTSPDSMLVTGSEDGTKTGVKHGLKVGSDLNLRVVDESANITLSNIENELLAINLELDAQTLKLNSIDGKDFSTSTKQDIQSVKLEDVKTKLDEIKTKLDTQITKLTSIDGKDFSTSAKQDIQAIKLEEIKTKIDSTNSYLSSIFLEVQENIKQKILKAIDRVQLLTYADFGTKDQRITQIEYSSALIPGIVARKTLVYTLVVNRYRRDNINWSII